MIMWVKTMALIDVIEKVVCGGLDFSAIGDYCDGIQKNKEGLLELKEAIEDYDLMDLYTTLFYLFEDELDHEEIAYYREKFRKTFDECFYPLIDGTKEDIEQEE